MTVRFITREGCTICVEALAQLKSAGRRARLQIDLVDVDADEALLAEYGSRVPVVLGDDGSVLAEGRISRKEAKAVVRTAKR